MEQTIQLDGKDVRLKATAYNLVIYKAEFGEDIFKVKNSLFAAINGGRLDLDKVDSLGIAKLTWAMAKTADETLPPFDQWMRSIEDFPTVDMITQNLTLFMTNMNQQSRIKKAPATDPEQAEEN